MVVTTSDEAEQSYVIFANAVLERLRARARERGVPTSRDFGVRFGDDGGWEETFDEKPNYWALFSDTDAEVPFWMTLPEATECGRQHIRAAIIPIPKMLKGDGTPILEPTFEQLYYSVAYELQFTLVRSIEAAASLDVSPDDLVATYRAHRIAWQSKTDVTEVSSIITGFESRVPSFAFGDDVQVLPFLPAEKSAFWSLFIRSAGGSVSMRDLSRSSFKLFATTSRDTGAPVSLGDVRERFISALTSLRLLKPGNVGLKSMYRRSSSPTSRGIGGSEFAMARTNWFGINYTLLEEDIPALQSLYLAVRSTEDDKRMKALTVGLRRFNQSYERSNPEDRIIDLTIALENTLLAGLKDELKSKIVLRGAAVLSNQMPAPDAAKTLSVLYDVRSAVVHQGQLVADLDKEIRKTKYEPHQFVDAVESCVRNILKYYLTRLREGKSISDVNDGLERRILDGLSPRPATDGAGQASGGSANTPAGIRLGPLL